MVPRRGPRFRACLNPYIYRYLYLLTHSPVSVTFPFARLKCFLIRSLVFFVLSFLCPCWFSRAVAPLASSFVWSSFVLPRCASPFLFPPFVSFASSSPSPAAFLCPLPLPLFVLPVLFSSVLAALCCLPCRLLVAACPCSRLDSLLRSLSAWCCLPCLLRLRPPCACFLLLCCHRFVYSVVWFVFFFQLFAFPSFCFCSGWFVLLCFVLLCSVPLCSLIHESFSFMRPSPKAKHSTAV